MSTQTRISRILSRNQISRDLRVLNSNIYLCKKMTLCNSAKTMLNVGRWESQRGIRLNLLFSLSLWHFFNKLLIRESVSFGSMPPHMYNSLKCLLTLNLPALLNCGHRQQASHHPPHHKQELLRLSPTQFPLGTIYPARPHWDGSPPGLSPPLGN